MSSFIRRHRLSILLIVSIAIIVIISISSFVMFDEDEQQMTSAFTFTNILSLPTISPTFPNPIRHVIIIVMENEEFSSVIGNNNSDASYQNSLASKYALASEYYAVSHPSLPNYFSLVAGTTFGLSSDCQPSECSQNGRNLIDLLNEKGLSWKSYAESMPTNCSQLVSQDGLYYPKHNPFVYFSDITGNEGSGAVSKYCSSHVVSFNQFGVDLANNNLPNFAFIVPNMCDDAHSCSLDTGDSWLAMTVPRIINSSEFKSTVLFIVYDEGATTNSYNSGQGGGQVACIIVSPFVKTGYKSENPYSHYSLLATIEAIYNLGNLGRNDTTATVMSDLFTIKF